MCSNENNKYKNKMLNLTVGKQYDITMFLTDKVYTVTVLKKTIHADTIHSYFMTWYNPDSIHDFARYFWDYGYANDNRTIVHNACSIRTCKEVCTNSSITN